MTKLIAIMVLCASALVANAQQVIVTKTVQYKEVPQTKTIVTQYRQVNVVPTTRVTVTTERVVERQRERIVRFPIIRAIIQGYR